MILSNSRKHRKQGGFTFVELTVVLVIVAVLSLLSYPRITSFLIEGRVKPTVDDMVGAATRIRANAEGSGSTPYASLSTSTLANSMRDRTVALVVTGVGPSATLQHKLGATGAQVTAAPATITTVGDSFTITVPSANAASCPSMPTSFQNNAEIVSINGTVVKSIPAAVAYNGQTAQDACTDGNTNTYVFTVR